MSYTSPSQNFLKNSRGTDSSVIAAELKKIGTELSNISTRVDAFSIGVFRNAIYVGMVGSGAEYECDGTDDHVQIQAAIDNATSGDAVILLSGVYNITTRIYKVGKSISLIGLGSVTININTPTGNDAGSNNGICLYGSTVVTTTVSESVTAGSITVPISDISTAVAGDILKIWKNVAWCPDDYADQMTGELYEIKSVSGSTITLGEPLLRDYATADTVTVVIYRPIEVHIENIKFICTATGGSTGYWEALSLRRCKNSTVENCKFSDFGFVSISFYNSYDVEIFGNKIYNCLKSGSGYGVGIWSGTAVANIHHNRIENCRHAVTQNSDEKSTLTRNVQVHHNTLIGATIDGANVIDSHTTSYDFTITDNYIYPRGSYCAFADGSQKSTFTNNYVSGGYGGVTKRGSVSNGYHCVSDNVIEGGSMVVTYRGLEYGQGEHLEVKNNTQNGGRYGVYIGGTSTEAYKSLVVTGNNFRNLSEDGINIILRDTSEIVDISNNIIIDPLKNGIIIDGSGYTFKNIKINGNQITDANYAFHYFDGIKLLAIQNAMIMNNCIVDSGGYPGMGINASTGCDYNVVIGNIAKGMTGTKFSLAGSNNVTDNNTELP